MFNSLQGPQGFTLTEHSAGVKYWLWVGLNTLYELPCNCVIYNLQDM
jgi:hypothetical protein